MTPHETGSTATPADARAAAPLTRTFGPQGPTLGDLSDAYLQDYQVRQFRSQSTARGRTAHLAAFFGRAARAATLTTYQIRQYQLTRRAAGAATGTINRETSALHRMCALAVHWGWLDIVPGFPDRLRENPPRQGFWAATGRVPQRRRAGGAPVASHGPDGSIPDWAARPLTSQATSGSLERGATSLGHEHRRRRGRRTSAPVAAPRPCRLAIWREGRVARIGR